MEGEVEVAVSGESKDATNWNPNLEEDNLEFDKEEKESAVDNGNLHLNCSLETDDDDDCSGTAGAKTNVASAILLLTQ